MKLEQNGVISDRLFKYGIILSLFLIGFGIYKLMPKKAKINHTANHSDLGVNALLISKEKPEFQEIQIPDQGLSQLIEIPPGRCSWINAPGWLEYYFLTGKGFTNSFSVTAGEQKWDKKISPSSRFKLKGQPGIAKIWLEPCPKNSRQQEMTHRKNQLCDSVLNDYSENSTICSVSIR